MEKKRRKIEKGKVENWKWKGEKCQNKERTFFFTFQHHRNCFRSPKMGIFYRERAFHVGEKSGKITLSPLKNILLTPLPLTQCTQTTCVFKSTTYRGTGLIKNRLLPELKSSQNVPNYSLLLLHISWLWLIFARGQNAFYIAPYLIPISIHSHVKKKKWN